MNPETVVEREIQDLVTEIEEALMRGETGYAEELHVELNELCNQAEEMEVCG